MKILMIGGTQFVGRAIAEAAIARGHEVTLFHRGQTNPDILPQADRIQGDRDGQLDRLGDREWDVVIDTCGYVPRVVQLSVDALKGRVKQYVFISTISVYDESDEIGRDEDTALQTMDDPTVEEITGETYGPLKVLCEQVVTDAFGNDALILRPGFIVGPHDHTFRYTYWPLRVRQGGEMLFPGDGSDKVQFVDVRDLADFNIKLVEEGQNGIYNVTGTAEAYTFQTVLDTAKAVTGSDVDFVKVDRDWLTAEDRVTGADLPLWLPSPEAQALMQVSIDRALAAGLSLRPLEETTRDTLSWVDRLDGLPEKRPGLSLEKEAALLADYRA